LNYFPFTIAHPSVLGWLLSSIISHFRFDSHKVLNLEVLECL
jgi:hypothetical protein